MRFSRDPPEDPCFSQGSTNPGAQESRNPGTQESRNPGIEESRNPGIQESRNPGVQESRDPGIQESRDLGIHVPSVAATLSCCRRYPVVLQLVLSSLLPCSVASSTGASVATIAGTTASVATIVFKGSHLRSSNFCATHIALDGHRPRKSTATGPLVSELRYSAWCFRRCGPRRSRILAASWRLQQLLRHAIHVLDQLQARVRTASRKLPV